VADGAPVYIQPRALQSALAQLPRGVTAPVEEVHDTWLRIRFEDPRWGGRVGYVNCAAVRIEVPEMPTPTTVDIIRVPPATAPAAAPSLAPAADAALEHRTGYLEWRRDDHVISDGQRVRWNASTVFRLERFDTFAAVPLGAELIARGRRLEDGSLLADLIDVRANSASAFERDAIEMANALEALYLEEGRMLLPGRRGELEAIGPLVAKGPEAARVRRVLDTLAPAHVDMTTLRVHVVRTPLWNATVFANGAMWIFTGLLEDVASDDELAIVLAHELAHYTHEHHRRSMRQGVRRRLTDINESMALNPDAGTTTPEAAARLTEQAFSAWANGYNRELEEQADRVALRYAYEAGFDVSQAPNLWRRTRARDGERDRLANFFVGRHSRPTDRIRSVEEQLVLNYSR
jgi:Zn-dependent protease with chaperone function